MQIYPAIDIQAQKCVRLYQGDYQAVTTYADDVITQAKLFVQQGANFLHIVDLDGAREGRLINLVSIKNICEQLNVAIQFGGGIRDASQIKMLLDMGVTRIIIGSLAVQFPEKIKQWLMQFGPEKIVLALDCRIDENGIPMLATHGWQQTQATHLWTILDYFSQHHVQHVLCTDIARDGTLNGPHTALYKQCVTQYPRIQFQASGGVRDTQDVMQLRAMNVHGVVIGKALYENKINLKQIIGRDHSC